MAKKAEKAAGKRIKGKERGAARKRALSARALADLGRWLDAARVALLRRKTQLCVWRPRALRKVEPNAPLAQVGLGLAGVLDFRGRKHGGNDELG